ncbi:GntR family transcriptional regulator [Aquabacterium sp. J223]|uniref:GntR family transcriptional regulator n=1 Tax=Aquabacterium sp. J223 TaxID=2898431 RepID=UPI0021AD84B1|nr:GntR family transcriptional regulator [Aquabacterium sp. J223]UUX94485.1 GntR family transcriptional regulator [Aquabacterium sp. J223]
MTPEPTAAPETAAARIYTAVKEQIIAGHYPAGARITEQQLAASFDSSRTPVREAMRQLVADGFVLFKPNSGSTVRRWSEQEVREIFETRALIESEIAALAAARATAAQVDALARLQDGIEACGPPRERAATAHPLGRLNREFHQIVAQAAGNERLVLTLAKAMEVPIVQQTFRRYTAAELARSFGHHRELIDALRSRDPAWARSVMSSHIHAAKHAWLAGEDHGR